MVLTTVVAVVAMIAGHDLRVPEIGPPDVRFPSHGSGPTSRRSCSSRSCIAPASLFGSGRRARVHDLGGVQHVCEHHLFCRGLALRHGNASSSDGRHRDCDVRGDLLSVVGATIMAWTVAAAHARRCLIARAPVAFAALRSSRRSSALIALVSCLLIVERHFELARVRRRIVHRLHYRARSVRPSPAPRAQRIYVGGVVRPLRRADARSCSSPTTIVCRCSLGSSYWRIGTLGRCCRRVAAHRPLRLRRSG